MYWLVDMFFQPGWVLRNLTRINTWNKQLSENHPENGVSLYNDLRFHGRFFGSVELVIFQIPCCQVTQVTQVPQVTQVASQITGP